MPDAPPPAVIRRDGSVEYEVDSILERRARADRLEYLVHWKGYADSLNTWVSASDLQHADQLLAAFLARNPTSSRAEFRVPEHTLFCAECGALLNVQSGEGDIVACLVCGHRTPLSSIIAAKGDIIASMRLKPSELIRRLSGRTAGALLDAQQAIVDEDCPVCKHPKMSYRTAQLRGLDEGQTVFYTCLNSKCGHKYSLHS